MSQAAGRAGGSRGLGLAEVLVSVAILSLMGTLIFGTFSRTMKTRARAEQVSQRYHQLRQAGSRMSRELGSAFLSEHRDCVDPRTSTLFWGRRSGAGARLDFTTFAHLRIGADVKESDQSEIGYYVAADPLDPQRQHLMRREKVRLDEHRGEGGHSEVMVEDVVGLRLSFYNPKADAWQEDWDDLATDTRGKLPKYVSVQIEYKEGSAQMTFVTRVRLFVREAVFPAGFGVGKCLQ